MLSSEPKTVIVANGHKFADALAGASLSGVLGGVPIILTDADRIDYDTDRFLRSSLIETVYILGGESAVSPLVEREISGRDVDERKDTIGKLVGAWLPIMLFVLIGYDHSIANMFYLTAAKLADSSLEVSLILYNLFYVTLGNFVGGMVIGLPLYFCYYKKQD